MSLSKFYCWSVFLLLPDLAFAELQVPPLKAPVVDQVKLLSEATTNNLNGALQSIRARGGSQIAVLIVPNLQGYSIEQFSIEVVEQWQLGSKQKDDGVLLVIAPEERALRIEVGQGLEGDLPDALSKRIIEENITPFFREGDFDRGVRAGVFEIARLTNPDMDISSLFEGVQSYAPRRVSRGPTRSFWFLFFMMLLPLLLARGRRRFSSPWYGAAAGAALGSSWGRRSSSYGGFGGFGGGGFGGGGGGFSGGGASGRW